MTMEEDAYAKAGVDQKKETEAIKAITNQLTPQNAVYAVTLCTESGCEILEKYKEIKSYVEIDNAAYVIMENKGQVRRVRHHDSVHSFFRFGVDTTLDFLVKKKEDIRTRLEDIKRQLESIDNFENALKEHNIPEVYLQVPTEQD
jgi:hypothetical protein